MSRAASREAILRAMMTDAPLSRADLARQTGFSRPTVSELVKELITEGAVREGARTQPIGPGKPGTLLDFDLNVTQVIAFDLSDTTRLSGALALPDGRLRSAVFKDHPNGRDDDLEAVIVEVAAMLLRQVDGRALGVGIGAPGGHSRYGGLGERLAERLGIDVFVGDDADLAADAEMVFGAAAAPFLLVRLGARVRTAVRVHIGDPVSCFALGPARELPHIVTGRSSDATCDCARSGCVHHWSSAPTVSRRLLARPVSDHGRVLREAGAHLGVPLAVLSSTLGSPKIVLSGPASMLRRDLSDAIASTLLTLADCQPNPVVQCSSLKQAVLQGAAVRMIAQRFGQG